MAGATGETRVFQARPSFLWGGLLLASVAVAAFVGFRLPNLWSVTLYNVTVWDGTVRRSLFGTALGPLWSAAGHRYSAYAAVAFLVLGLLIAVIIVNAVRARWSAQKTLVIAWFLAPTGAFLFHEVGYQEQVNYLLLFLSMWLWRRTRTILAVVPVTLSILVHENALLTTLPVLVWYGVQDLRTRRQAWAFLLPGLVGAVCVLWPPLSDQRVSRIVERLDRDLPFKVRSEAIGLFGRTQAEAWARYSPLRGLVAVLPFALVIASFWIGLLVVTRRRDLRVEVIILGALGASLAPLALVLAGGDFSRWVFLGLSNFALVLFLWLAKRPKEPSGAMVASMLLPLALLFFAPLAYFDDYSPRSINLDGPLEKVIEHPDFFQFPVR